MRHQAHNAGNDSNPRPAAPAGPPRHVVVATAEQAVTWGVFRAFERLSDVRVTGCSSMTQARSVCAFDPPQVIKKVGAYDVVLRSARGGELRDHARRLLDDKKVTHHLTNADLAKSVSGSETHRNHTGIHCSKKPQLGGSSCCFRLR